MTHCPGWETGVCGSELPTGTGHSPGVTYLPVSRRGHTLGRRELERVHHSQDLVKVASGGGGVEEGQLQTLVRADDEDLKRRGAHL